MDKKEKIISRDKANLIKDSLRIVDMLGELDEYLYDNDSILFNLIVKSKKLKKNRLWKL